MASESSPQARVFDVHLFPVVRLKASGVMAASHEQAIEKALEQVVPELPARLANSGIEYAEEVSHFLVDVAGDAEYRQSHWYYSREEPLLSYLSRLVAWYDADRADDDALEKLVAEAREALRSAV
jgi:hypothetical protein